MEQPHSPLSCPVISAKILGRCIKRLSETSEKEMMAGKWREDQPSKTERWTWPGVCWLVLSSHIAQLRLGKGQIPELTSSHRARVEGDGGGGGKGGGGGVTRSHLYMTKRPKKRTYRTGRPRKTYLLLSLHITPPDSPDGGISSSHEVT